MAFSWHSVMLGCMPVLLCAMVNVTDQSNYADLPTGRLIVENETEEPSEQKIVWYNEPLDHSDSQTFLSILLGVIVLF